MLVTVLWMTLAGEAPEFFPTITSEDLNGRRVTVPRDLAGEYRLVFLGYERDQQAVIDPWIRFAVSLERPAAKLGISELALIDDPGAIGRGVITAAMKVAIRDAETRGRVITVFGDQRAMLKATGSRSAATVDIVLLDKDGRIVWREEGPLTEEKKTELRGKLTES